MPSTRCAGPPGSEAHASLQFLFEARNEFGMDLATSFTIGDELIDLECGWNADGQANILTRTGYGRRLERDFAA